MAKSEKESVKRRDFLKDSAAMAALVAGAGNAAVAAAPEPRRLDVPAMSKEAETGNPSTVEVLTTDRPGADFMVDIIKSLGIEYIAANPG